MRTFLGSLVAALALAGAVYLHSARLQPGWGDWYCLNGDSVDGLGFICGETGTSTKYLPNGRENYAAERDYGVTRDRLYRHGTWQDPLAIFIAVAGVGAGAGIALRR